jgi:GT2 family glycosyltransferase
MTNTLAEADAEPDTKQPLASVIVLNYNGTVWLERCLRSLHEQTIFNRLEVIVADNASPDGSARLAAELMEGWPNGRVVQNGANFGYCEGNNRGAATAAGRYLFFLNNDTWLETECMERLLDDVTASGAAAACPLVMNYEDNEIQSTGASGFDIFGLSSTPPSGLGTTEILIASGCALLIEADMFRKLGGFDAQFFMYADEHDLSWRVWIAGGKVMLVTPAKLHHRGSAAVNPLGQTRIVESRTSDTTRFYATRNNLLVVLKNAQHLLLATALLQLLLLGAEAMVFLALTRRWSFMRRAYLQALAGCWSLRNHIRLERSHLRHLRQRSDWWMLRFLRWRPSRWEDVRRLLRHGVPRVDAK